MVLTFHVEFMNIAMSYAYFMEYEELLENMGFYCLKNCGGAEAKHRNHIFGENYIKLF